MPRCIKPPPIIIIYINMNKKTERKSYNNTKKYKSKKLILNLNLII